MRNMLVVVIFNYISFLTGITPSIKQTVQMKKIQLTVVENFMGIASLVNRLKL